MTDKNKCFYCGDETHPVEVVSFFGKMVMPAPEVCSKPVCVLKNDRQYEADLRSKLPPPETPIPPLFKDTALTRLPKSLQAFAESWEPDGKGLLIHGSTRKGKTRTAWMIADRLWTTNGTRYLFLTMFELEARLVASWGKEAWDKVMYQMAFVPVLFLDDLGKEKMTDRMASCLFALIDQRTMHKKSTVITTNLTGDTLLERFHDKETGAAFVARLKDPDLFRIAVAKDPEDLLK